MRARLAPGARAEMNARGFDVTLDEALPGEFGPDVDAAIIGMRADAPGDVVPGTRFDFTCTQCSHAVRLAPSGQKVAAAGTSVWCFDCLAATVRS